MHTKGERTIVRRRAEEEEKNMKSGGVTLQLVLLWPGCHVHSWSRLHLICKYHHPSARPEKLEQDGDMFGQVGTSLYLLTRLTNNCTIHRLLSSPLLPAHTLYSLPVDKFIAHRSLALFNWFLCCPAGLEFFEKFPTGILSLYH